MLAVIIPNLNAGKSLESLLAQLSERSRAEFRIIVSDGVSEDDSLKIAARYNSAIVIGTASRGGQLRRGAKWADKADWLLFIHADSQLPDNWHAIINSHIQDHPGKAGYFNLRLDSRQFGARLVEVMVKLRNRAWALPYGDQGLLISKTLYDEIGGYPDWSLFEDVKIVEKIGRKRLRVLPAIITTSAAKFERDGFLKRGWRNYQLLRRYKSGEPVDSLMASYL